MSAILKDFDEAPTKSIVSDFDEIKPAKPISILDDFDDTAPREATFGDKVEGIWEATKTVVTGIPATIISGVAGLGTAAAKKAGITEADPVKLMEYVREELTYQPKTEFGQKAVETIAWPFEKISQGADYLGEKTRVGTGSPALATGVRTAAEFIPWLLLPKVGRGVVKGGKKTITKTGEIIAKVTPKPVKDIIGKYAIDPIAEISKHSKEILFPITSGIKEVRGMAKDYANTIRKADFLRNHVIDKLKAKDKTIGKPAYADADYKSMSRAVIEEELAAKRGVETSKGIDSLPPHQKQAVMVLLERHKKVADEAVKVGVLKVSKDIYYPRKIAEVLGEESYKRIEKAGGFASIKHAKKRQYETVEGTAAAASKVLGKDVKVVEDIRILPIVTAELERAIAGRILINKVKALEKDLGYDKKAFTPGELTTIDHPAFYRWQPKLDPKTKKPLIDSEGNVVFEKQQIQIPKDFVGPLNAVLQNKMTKPVEFLMNLKAKSMSLIMFSPLMHGMVIWGKAFPYQMGRSLSLRNYRDGHKLLSDSEWVKNNTPFKTSEEFITHATNHGLSPIGNMGWVQRMTDVLQAPHLNPGRSLTAKAFGNVFRVFGKEAKQKVMRGVDKAGEIWHDKMLWEQIRNMQFGLYNNLYGKFQKQGMNETAAGEMAAHFANRFAGAIPFEDMGAGFRSTLNIVLFSRSFNATNAGIYKDALKGLPRVLQERILKAGSELDLKVANDAVKKAARATLTKDIIAMYMLNGMMDKFMVGLRGEDVGKQLQEDFESYAESVRNNPANLVFGIPHLTGAELHEKGKKHRIYMGETKDKTSLYMRFPVGKIGEDLEKMFTSPKEMLFAKLSPTLKFMVGVAFNDKTGMKKYGKRVYDEQTDMMGIPENIGRIASYFFESHLPSSYIDSVIDAATGEDPTKLYGKYGIQKIRTFSEWLGFSWSKGGPGGPVAADMMTAIDEYKKDISDHMPDIKKQLQLQNYDKAVDLMINEAGMSARHVDRTLRNLGKNRLSERLIRDFIEIADEKQLKRMDKQLERFYK